MRIGIDISQIVYEGSGVASYVKNSVRALLTKDSINEYILFGTSLRQKKKLHDFHKTLSRYSNVRLVALPVPSRFFEFLWNRLGIVPIEWLIGRIDVFWSSDWMQPPLHSAKGVTTIHDISFLRFPQTFPLSIRQVHDRRLKRVKTTCQKILCDSEATKKDIIDLLHIPSNRLVVIYPGFSIV